MDYGNIFAHLFEQQLALHCMILDHHILIYCHILPYIYVLYHLQNHGRTEIPEIPEMVMKICGDLGDLRCGMMWTESLTSHVRYGWCTLNWEPLAD